MPRTRNGNSRQRRQRREREALSALVDHGRLLLARDRIAQPRVVSERTRGTTYGAKRESHPGKVVRRLPSTRQPRAFVWTPGPADADGTVRYWSRVPESEHARSTPARQAPVIIDRADQRSELRRIASKGSDNSWLRDV